MNILFVFQIIKSEVDTPRECVHVRTRTHTCTNTQNKPLQGKIKISLSHFAGTFSISSSCCCQPRLEVPLGAVFSTSSVTTSTAPMTPLSMSPATGRGGRAGRRQPGWKVGQRWIWPAIGRQVPTCPGGRYAIANVFCAELAQGGLF